MISRALLVAVVAGATTCHAFVPSGNPLALRRSTLSISTRAEKATARPSIHGVKAGLLGPAKFAPIYNQIINFNLCERFRETLNIHFISSSGFRNRRGS